MDKISNDIEALGFRKWFQDNVDPVDLKSFDVARVIAVHKVLSRESLYHEMSYLEKRQKDKQFGKLGKTIMKYKEVIRGKL